MSKYEEFVREAIEKIEEHLKDMDIKKSQLRYKSPIERNNLSDYNVLSIRWKFFREDNKPLDVNDVLNIENFLRSLENRNITNIHQKWEDLNPTSDKIILPTHTQFFAWTAEASDLAELEDGTVKRRINEGVFNIIGSYTIYFRVDNTAGNFHEAKDQLDRLFQQEYFAIFRGGNCEIYTLPYKIRATTGCSIQ